MILVIKINAFKLMVEYFYNILFFGLNRCVESIEPHLSYHSITNKFSYLTNFTFNRLFIGLNINGKLIINVCIL